MTLTPAQSPLMVNTCVMSLLGTEQWQSFFFEHDTMVNANAMPKKKRYLFILAFVVFLLVCFILCQSGEFCLTPAKIQLIKEITQKRKKTCTFAS